MDRYLEPSFRFVPIFIALLMILGPMTGMIGFSNDFTELSNEEKWVGPPGVGTSNATIITTTIKALIFIIIIIQQQSYQWVCATTGSTTVTLLPFGVVLLLLVLLILMLNPPSVY
mgnify:CR=1 FL=1